MNYTELIDRFWRLDEERPFTTAETRMYMKLLDMFSRVGFDHSVSMCNALAVGLFGISLCCYKSALHGLVQRGLIAVEYHKVQRRRCAVFTLVTQSAEPAEPEIEPNRPTTEPEAIQEAKPDKPADESEREEPAAQSRPKLPQRIRIVKQQHRRQPPHTNHRHKTRSCRLTHC